MMFPVNAQISWHAHDRRPVLRYEVRLNGKSWTR